MPQIQVVTFDLWQTLLVDRPEWSQERARLRLEGTMETLRAAGEPFTEERVKVASPEEAERARFLGSPTVRINGVDVEKAALSDTNYGLRCRVYSEDGDVVGWPSRETIRDTIRSVSA